MPRPPAARSGTTVVRQPQVSYTWDNANRLTGVTQGSSAVSLQYDSANRKTQLTLPNGIVVAYTYDADSRVSGMTWTLNGNQIGNLDYAYDGDGGVVSKTGSMAATGMPASVSGNTFNADNGMTAFNGAAMTYDANGNLTSDGTNNYTWDARNHLTAISGAVTASFEYDALGRRMSKTIAGTTTHFLYDGLNPVQEIQSGSPSANLLTGLNIDQIFQRTDSAGARDFLTDALGSTLALADSSGAIQTSYTYEPFGNTTVLGASSTNRFQFTGRENDGTGLYYYRARYYSPTFQRFVSQDPLGLGAGPNVYEYVVGDPTDFRDPRGNQLLAAIATAAAVGAASGAIAGGIAGFFGGSPCASVGQRFGNALHDALEGAGVGAVVGATTAIGAIGEVGGAVLEGATGGLVGGGGGAAGGIGSGIGGILTEGSQDFVTTVFKGALGGFGEAGFEAATGGGGGSSPCGCQ